MAHKTGKDADFMIDNAAGSIVSIKGSVNSASIQSALSMLEDSGLGDENSTFQPGLAGGSLPINGFIDSTTGAIFGPLAGSQHTSIQKTYGFYDGVNWYTGESSPESVQISGAPNTLVTFSCTLRLDGATTKTSVTPS